MFGLTLCGAFLQGLQSCDDAMNAEYACLFFVFDYSKKTFPFVLPSKAQATVLWC